MIPHHINAINMAKSALKLQSDRVGDAWDEMGVMMSVISMMMMMMMMMISVYCDPHWALPQSWKRLNRPPPSPLPPHTPIDDIPFHCASR